MTRHASTQILGGLTQCLCMTHARKFSAVQPLGKWFCIGSSVDLWGKETIVSVQQL
jgi:hypothetical protein